MTVHTNNQQQQISLVLFFVFSLLSPIVFFYLLFSPIVCCFAYFYFLLLFSLILSTIFYLQINTVFDGLSATKGFVGHVIFLEEDHFISPDFVHTAQLLIKQQRT